MLRCASRVVVLLGAGALFVSACDFKLDPPTAGSTTPVDSGKYDCSKFAGYKKLCPNDPPPIQSPTSLCEDHANHKKCADLGVAIMECLWSLQSRKDMCGADGVTIPGRVMSLCGSQDSADEDCRARNP